MSSKRMLLIEDDFDVAEMLLMYFQSHDYNVLHADTGGEGVEIARTKFPTLILLDVMLPDMDGYDVCRKLREASLTKYIPIIFLTQRDERASKVRGLELGADDYITKPFDIDELRLRVQGSIRRATREHLHETRTGLPTGPLVEEEIARRHGLGKPYGELTISLDNWSAYNDVYGFVAGNAVMEYASRCIQTAIAERGTANDFVGISGDSFIVLTHSAAPEKLETAIKAEFETQIKAFYSFLDAERGGILLNPGTDTERVAPLMSCKCDIRVVMG